MPAREPSRLALFFGANVLFSAGLFFHAFLYNFYLDHLALSESIMGNAQAALTAGGVLSLIPAGRLVDRMGSKRVILLAAALNMAGLAWGALVATPIAIYGAAGLAGLGAGSWRVAVAPFLMQLTTPGQRARAFSWNVGLLVGFGGAWIALAGVVPSWVETIFGWSPLEGTRAALLSGVLVTAASVPCYTLLPETSSSDQGSAPRHSEVSSRRATPKPLTTGALFVLVAFVAFWMTAPALVTPFFNIYFDREFALSVARIGLIFALAHGATALLVFASGEAAARVGPAGTLAAWTLLFGPMLFGLAATEALGVSVALYFLQGAVAPASNPLIDQILLERAAEDRRGTVSSWRNAATEGSAIWGASVGGLILEAGTFATLFLLAGGLGLVAAVSLIVAVRHFRAR